MNSSYLWLKAVHVLAAAVWMGAATSLWALLGRVASTPERERRAGLVAACDMIGRQVIAPAAGTTLLLGIAAMWIGHTGMALWIIIGMIAAVLLIAVGGGILSRMIVRLAKMLDEAATPASAFDAMLGRVRTLASLSLIIVLATIVVMVLKPV